MTPAEQAIAAQALADQFAEIASGEQHQVVLVALLSMYRATALNFTCCLKSAAEQCVAIGLELALRQAQQQQPPSGAPLH